MRICICIRVARVLGHCLCVCVRPPVNIFPFGLSSEIRRRPIPPIPPTHTHKQIRTHTQPDEHTSSHSSTRTQTHTHTRLHLCLCLGFCAATNRRSVAAQHWVNRRPSRRTADRKHPATFAPPRTHTTLTHTHILTHTHTITTSGRARQRPGARVCTR